MREPFEVSAFAVASFALTAVSLGISAVILPPFICIALFSYKMLQSIKSGSILNALPFSVTAATVSIAVRPFVMLITFSPFSFGVISLPSR